MIWIALAIVVVVAARLTLPPLIAIVRFRMQFLRAHGRPATKAEVDAFFQRVMKP
jgi:hypothetical protein